MAISAEKPLYLPRASYMARIIRSEIHIVVDDIPYSRGTDVNRALIKTASGPTILTAPVHAGLGMPLHHVRLVLPAHWQRKHWRAIELSYRNAPYFEHYEEFLRETYACDWQFLVDLNLHILAGLVTALGASTRILRASQLGVPGAGLPRLAALVKAVGGVAYLAEPETAETVQNASVFANAGIHFEVLSWHPPIYRQRFGGFAPDLSVLDLLMNCGPDAFRILLAASS
jgi:hypothetical protein